MRLEIEDQNHPFGVSLRVTDPDSVPMHELLDRLHRFGVVLLDLEWSGAHATFMENLVRRIGTVNLHDAHATAVWDIRFDAKAETGHRARSHTMGEFPFHTDCSFENPPPNGMALFCVREDRLGGGLTGFIAATDVLARLSPESIRTLKQTHFRIRVPPEFSKDVPWTQGPLLDERNNFRYRRDIIDDSALNPQQLAALNELEEVIAGKVPVHWGRMPANQLLIADNGRFLHARTEIHDPERHLQRVRFHFRPELVAPSFATELPVAADYQRASAAGFTPDLEAL